jgi:hypothetical protein
MPLSRDESKAISEKGKKAALSGETPPFPETCENGAPLHFLFSIEKSNGFTKPGGEALSVRQTAG